MKLFRFIKHISAIHRTFVPSLWKISLPMKGHPLPPCCCEECMYRLCSPQPNWDLRIPCAHHGTDKQNQTANLLKLLSSAIPAKLCSILRPQLHFTSNTYSIRLFFCVTMPVLKVSCKKHIESHFCPCNYLVSFLIYSIISLIFGIL